MVDITLETVPSEPISRRECNVGISDVVFWVSPLCHFADLLAMLPLLFRGHTSAMIVATIPAGTAAKEQTCTALAVFLFAPPLWVGGVHLPCDAAPPPPRLHPPPLFPALTQHCFLQHATCKPNWRRIRQNQMVRF